MSRTATLYLVANQYTPTRLVSRTYFTLSFLVIFHCSMLSFDYCLTKVSGCGMLINGFETSEIPCSAGLAVSFRRESTRVAPERYPKYQGIARSGPLALCMRHLGPVIAIIP